MKWGLRRLCAIPNCRCSVYHHIEMTYDNGKKTTDDMDIASKDDYI